MCFNQKTASAPAPAPQAADPAPIEAETRSARTNAQKAAYGQTGEPDFRRPTSSIPVSGGSGVNI